MANSVLWFQVLGRNAQGLRDFYRDVFRWKISDGDTSNGGDYGYVESGSGGIPGGIGSGSDRSLSHATFYVEVEDQLAIVAKARELGGRVINPPSELRGGKLTFGYMSDPEGHVIGLSTGLSARPDGSSSNPVLSFEIMGQDSNSLREFYKSLFGWTMNEAPFPDYWEVDPGESIRGGIGPARAAGLRSDDGFATFKVEVADPEATLARVRELGGETVMKMYAVPGTGLRVAYFTDPEGHIVGLTGGLA